MIIINYKMEDISAAFQQRKAINKKNNRKTLQKEQY